MDAAREGFSCGARVKVVARTCRRLGGAGVGRLDPTSRAMIVHQCREIVEIGRGSGRSCRREAARRPNDAARLCFNNNAVLGASRRQASPYRSPQATSSIRLPADHQYPRRGRYCRDHRRTIPVSDPRHADRRSDAGLHPDDHALRHRRNALTDFLLSSWSRNHVSALRRMAQGMVIRSRPASFASAWRDPDTGFVPPVVSDSNGLAGGIDVRAQPMPKWLEGDRYGDVLPVEMPPSTHCCWKTKPCAVIWSPCSLPFCTIDPNPARSPRLSRIDDIIAHAMSASSRPYTGSPSRPARSRDDVHARAARIALSRSRS